MEWKLILQVVGIALGLLYLYLEYKANIWLWVVGIIMPIVHGTLYFKSGLYADCSMQVYYILAGLYGLVAWSRKPSTKTQEDKSRGICQTPAKTWGIIFLLYVTLHAAIYFILIKFTDSTVPFWDALTTALSFIAMWMLARKYIEQWILWIAVDTLSVGLYIYKGIYFYAGLYALYAIIAVFGYINWRKIMKNEHNTPL